MQKITPLEYWKKKFSRFTFVKNTIHCRLQTYFHTVSYRHPKNELKFLKAPPFLLNLISLVTVHSSHLIIL